MITTNATDFRNHVYDYIKQASQFSDVITVTSKSGNAVLVGEDDYKDMQETLYLMNCSKVMEDIKEAEENMDNPDYWMDEKEIDWGV